MWRKRSRYFIPLTIMMVLASSLTPSTVVNAGWARLSGEGFLPEQICRDGIRFGFVTSGTGTFSAKGDLNTGNYIDDSRVLASTVMDPPTVNPLQPADYGAEAGGYFEYERAASYALRWSSLQDVGTELKMRIDKLPYDPDSEFIIDPLVAIEDCRLFDLTMSVADSPDPVTSGGRLFYTLKARNTGSAGTIARVSTFANSGKISIPGSGAATAYPSSISVSGLAGTVTKVSVTLQSVVHPSLADLDVLLVSPKGQKVMLMSDAGVGSGAGFEPMTFDDEATDVIPADNSAVGGKSYRPANYGGRIPDLFPAPAPAAPYGTALSGFNGTVPNGTWSLYIVDDDAISNNVAGSIDGGWSLTLTTNAVPVTIKNTLAIGVTFISASGTRWSCTRSGRIVTCVYAYGGTETPPDLKIEVTAPKVKGLITNRAAITSAFVEGVPGNNGATTTTTVRQSVFIPLITK